MAGRYKPYPEYTDSESEWLGRMPAHWSATKIGFLSQKTGSGKTPKGGSEVYLNSGVLFLRSQNIYDTGLRLDDELVFISEETDSEMAGSRVQSGDILLNITGASIGRTCIVPEGFQKANVNQHVCIIRVPVSFQRYLALYLKSTIAKAQIDSAQSGAAREGLNFEQLSNIVVFMPKSEVERELIANFLDHETAKIDIMIEKQKQLIQLLKEKRQAVISHAITKGLNSKAKMRDSGIDWLGEVPDHWISCSLKHYARVIDCKHITAEFFDNGIPIASIGEVKEWHVNLQTAKFTSEEYYLDLISGGRKPQPGDIIYSRNATVGEAALVAAGMPNFAMGQDVCIIRLDDDLLPEFILHVLKSPVILQQLDLAMVGSTFKRINVDDIKNFSLALPSVIEQAEIAEKIKRTLGKYDALASKAQAAIELMQERRTALISSAVTGKIDVRNWVVPKERQTNKEVAA